MQPSPRRRGVPKVVGVEAAKRSLASTVAAALREGEGNIPEAHDGVNQASRILVEAVKQEAGEAWLGLINPRESRGESAKQWRYDGTLYTFGADYVLPAPSQAVETLVAERLAAEYSSEKDYERVIAISKAVLAAGGVNLVWS